MKTINSFRSKLFALTLAITASVASFAYEFEYVNDFHIDGFGYKIISVNTPDDGEGYVSLIEIADCKKDVVIPKYVSYGDRGFHVTTFGIGSVVFTNDASSVVESITIPKTTSVINKNALAGCPNLKTVVVDSENPYYDSRENCNAIITTSQNPYFTPNTLIAGCKTTIIPNSVVEIGENAFYDCESLETITIPNSVTKIGKSAFNVCSTLSSITLSENLTEIGNWAFDDCNNLKEVICYAPQPPTISKYTFSDISPTVYVPENTVTIYQNAPYWMTFAIQPINVGPFNEKLLGTWRVVGGNEIISISDSIIVFIGLTQKYTASATQLTVERLWIPEEESYRWANCNYTLSNDTLWIDNFMPLLVATYPPTFGPITLVKVKNEDLFPTLWGLRRTHTIEMYDYAPNDGKRSGGYPLSFAPVKDTIINGKTYLQFSDNLHELDYSLFFLREENNKVLIYSSILQDDLVLYDYTLEVGDSLYTIEGYDWFDDVNITKLKKTKDAYVVTDVSTITLLDGIERKKWSLYKGYTPLEYVEGIGCFGENLSWPGDFFRLITNYPYIAESVGDHLVCVSKNGQLLYSMTKDEMNSFTWTCECLSEKDTTYYKSKWCDTWNMLVRTGSIYPPSSTPYRYQLAKDTVIGEHTYTAVVQKEINDALDAPHYVAAVRFTDDRKVYIYYDNAEYLLYDFNVQEGDELEVFAGINNYTSEIKTYKCTVTGVEQYACVGCPAAITLEVHNHPNDFREFYRETQWIEGVGDINGFLNGINHYVEMDGGGSEYLLCAYKGDELKYTGDLYEEYGCGDDAEQSPEDLFPTLWGLQQTICSGYYGEEGDEWASGLTGPSQEITMMDGKPYLQWGSWYLREKNDKILVYSEIQKKDLVLYDFTLELGDTLTTLNLVTPEFLEYEGIVGIVDYPLSDYDYTYPIDTLVVTELSKETLLDGKEYTRWKFSDGTVYVEGIGSMSETFFHHIADHLPVPVSYLGSYLVCVSKNNKLLYQMDDAEMERLGAECLCEVETSYKSQWCDTWNVMWFDGLFFDETASTSQYRLGKDTVIGDYTYSKFTSRTSVRFTDDRKVYVYYEGFDDNDPYTEDLPTGEYLAYDFSAQVGDTLEVFSGSHSYATEQCVVYDVQTDPETNLRTMMLHPLCVVDGDGNVGVSEEEITWLEGVGSPNGFLISTPLPGGGLFALLCAYKGDDLKYTGSLYDEYGCEYNAGVVSDDLFPTLSGLQRTICREYCEQADNKTRIEQFTNLTTRTETGGPYLYYSPFLLREKDNKILIYSRTLNKDLVLYDFNLQVGDSLPMLYIDFFAEDDWIADRDMEIWCVVDYHKDLEGNILPADTLIVTDVSAITLLDGKEYKKWTFNNGMEYVEGIGSFGNRQWSGDFFQLIGNMDIPVSLHGEHLVCASRNGKLLYQMDDAEMERLGTECLCDYDRGPRKDNAKNGKIGGRPTPTQWNMLEVETKELDGTPTILRAETFSYTLENDSIIANNKTFYQLARQSTKDTAITKSFVGALHFGEDEDNRVYFLRDGVEYVLYDFTAEPGDTIEIFAGINNYPQETTYTHVVTGKDTLENGACRMMLEVVFPEGIGSDLEQQHLQKIWLAGLGSIDGIVHNAAKRTSDAHAAPSRSASSETQTSVMLCAWREDSCLYTTNHPEYDTFGCVYNQDPTAIENLTSPSSYQKIIHEGTLLILHEGKVYNVIGIQIK